MGNKSAVIILKLDVLNYFGRLMNHSDDANRNIIVFNDIVIVKAI